MLNRGVTPFVPSQGSVGASGDLAPLAHLALSLIVLEAKETISLINGTQAMLAVGTLAVLAAETLVDTADVLGGLCCDALKGTDTAFDELRDLTAAAPRRGRRSLSSCSRKLRECSDASKQQAFDF